jgi:hypothetical protein
MKKVKEHWLEVQIGQRRGKFPITYLDIIQPCCSPTSKPIQFHLRFFRPKMWTFSFFSNFIQISRPQQQVALSSYGVLITDLSVHPPFIIFKPLALMLAQLSQCPALSPLPFTLFNLPVLMLSLLSQCSTLSTSRSHFSSHRS